MVALVIILVILVVAGLTVAGRSFKVVQQYEQGIIFRFGKVLGRPRGAGLTVIRPFGDRMQKVNMQIVAMTVPAQDGITKDNVTVRVDAVVYFRVVDPIKAVINVQNYTFAISQQAQTSLRSIIGQSEMDQLLSERDTVNRELRRIIDEPTEGPWGIRVERVEIKDVSLPESMKRSMSRQAEAERERRARIITADGEYQASKRLAAAANVMARDPAALQLRLLQTVVEVAAEKNSTLVMPVPVELLRFFDKFTPPSACGRPELSRGLGLAGRLRQRGCGQGRGGNPERSAAADTQASDDPHAAHAGGQRRTGRRRSGPAQRRRRGLGRIGSAPPIRRDAAAAIIARLPSGFRQVGCSCWPSPVSLACAIARRMDASAREPQRSWGFTHRLGSFSGAAAPREYRARGGRLETTASLVLTAAPGGVSRRCPHRRGQLGAGLPARSRPGEGRPGATAPAATVPAATGCRPLPTPG
jgi:regulator of protease activity HflC (stomatin/prohibitin superfamily)